MSEIKNTIITISGEPASGKSTVIKSIKRKYEELGYIVHIEPIGSYWRQMAIETYKKLKPEIQDPTIDQIHADPNFELFRKDIDLALDSKVTRRGEEINSKPRSKEIFIFDSRLAWRNIPYSYAIRLTVDERIAGQRVFNDNKRGKEDQYPSVEAAIAATKTRKQEELKRYMKRYGVDLTEPGNYNLIADTSYANVEELAEIIIKGEEAYREDREFPKLWASPAAFLSEQKLRSTYDDHVEFLLGNMKKDGYNFITGTLHMAEHNGVRILLDGNHRVCAGLSMGKTLFPYIITHEDDRHSENIANSIYEDPTLERLYDWVDILRYRGGKCGNIEEFKNFTAQQLTEVWKAPILKRRLQLEQVAPTIPSGEDR